MNTSEIPQDPSLRWEWIKYQLRARGSSLAQLARSLDVSGPAVKNAKASPYPRVERAIASALELTPAQLWPERWDTNGNPCRRRPNRSESQPNNTQENNQHNAGYDLGHRKTRTDK